MICSLGESLLLIIPDTSKFNNLETEYHGGTGTFLSSLSAVSILTITSHHQDYNSTNALTFHHSRLVARLLPVPNHMRLNNRAQGTKITVQDLFGNLAVRVKQRPTADDGLKLRDKAWRSLSRFIVGFLLAWGTPVQLSLRGPDKDQALNFRSPQLDEASKTSHHKVSRTFNPLLIQNILVQGSAVDASRWDSWIKSSVKTPLLMIRALFSTDPAPSKDIQFIALGIHPIGDDHPFQALYHHINSLFSASSFGTEEDNRLDNTRHSKKREDKRYKRDGFTKDQLRTGRKGVDRWPMYYVRIDVQSSIDAGGTQRKVSEDEATMLSVQKALEALVTSFLVENHLKPKRRTPKSHKASEPEVSETYNVPDKTEGANERSSSRPKMAAELGDFSKDLKFTTLSRRQMPAENSSFSFWSRVKTGSGRSLSLPANNNPIQAVTKIKQTSPTTLPTPSPRASSTESSEGRTELAEDGTMDRASLPEAAIDEYVLWKNPISKDEIRVNGRTGLESGNARRSSANSKRPSSKISSIERTSHGMPHRLYSSSADRLRSPRPGSWASLFLEQWDNPVFQKTEEKIKQAGDDRLDSEKAGVRCQFFEILRNGSLDLSSSSAVARLSKVNLKRAQAISQVDSKFILIKMHVGSGSHGPDNPHLNHLVLVDQHAADERIRLETLLHDICAFPGPEAAPIKSSLRCSSLIKTELLAQRLSFDIPSRDHDLFMQHAHHFANWGILYDLVAKDKSPTNKSHPTNKLVVTTLPQAILDRCCLEPATLIDLMRREVWKLEESGMKRSEPLVSPHSRLAQGESEDEGDEWIRRTRECPQGILDLLCSRACRSAVMFNDELSLQSCTEMLQKLADCHFPFQCAHGRPSMVPLVDLGGFESSYHEESNIDFRTAWQEWERNGYVESLSDVETPG